MNGLNWLFKKKKEKQNKFIFLQKCLLKSEKPSPSFLDL